MKNKVMVRAEVMEHTITGKHTCFFLQETPLGFVPIWASDDCDTAEEAYQAGIAKAREIGGGKERILNETQMAAPTATTQ